MDLSTAVDGFPIRLWRAGRGAWAPRPASFGALVLGHLCRLALPGQLGSATPRRPATRLGASLAFPSRSGSTSRA